jgi:predicted protein tyrosine phosphatase
MRTRVFSKETFVKAMESRNITDDTVETLKEYFICIDPTGGPSSQRYFLQDHHNVIRLVFDDCQQDEVKWGIDINANYNAKAMVIEQAELLVKFIKQIPDDMFVNIYCTKGKSRSVAVASFINNQTEGNPHVLKLLRQAWIGK